MNEINKDIINLCIVFNDSDGDYIVKCLPTIFSILENNKEENVDLYVIYKGSNEVYIDYLKEIFNNYNQNLYLINDFKDKEYLVDFFKDNNTSSWNYGTFFKLLIPLLLPGSIDKVINLDSDDIIVNGSLREMWEIGLDNNLIASVEIPETSEKNEKIKVLNIKKPFRMGGNVYNLEEIRKIDFEGKVKEIMIKKIKKFKNAELDILNIICDDRVLYIDDKFNFCPSNYKKMSSDKLVYHFAGKKFHLFKYIFGINSYYKELYEKYYILPEYKIKKRFDAIRILNSVPIFNFFIGKIIKLLEFLGIKKVMKSLLFYK